MFVVFNLTCFLTPVTMDGKTAIHILLAINELRNRGDRIGGIIIRTIYRALGLNLSFLKEIADTANPNISNSQLAQILYGMGVDEMTFYKYGGAFWAAYVGIVVCFFGLLACGYIAFSEKNSQKHFYKLSLVTISYTGLIACTILGIVCCIIPEMPMWLGAIICIGTFLITLILELKAAAATEIISDKDDEIKEKTKTMKNLASKAKALYDDADKEYSGLLKKIYEEIRYSDPVSNKDVEDEENDIECALHDIAKAIEKHENIDDLVEKVLGVISNRNEKLKTLK